MLQHQPKPNVKTLSIFHLIPSQTLELFVVVVVVVAVVTL